MKFNFEPFLKLKLSSKWQILGLNFDSPKNIFVNMKLQGGVQGTQLKTVRKYFIYGSGHF